MPGSRWRSRCSRRIRSQSPARPTSLSGVAHERMEELGSVILMEGKRFEAGLTGEGEKVTGRIRADMEGSDSGDAERADTTWVRALDRRLLAC